MTKLSLIAAVVATAALCTSASTSAAVQVNDSTPLVSFTVFVPCANGGAGELIVLDGMLHTLITFTINGNNVSGKTHFQPQGLSGAGTITGDKYNGVGVTQEHFKSSLQNGQFSDTFINNFRMIGQGPGNNFQVHENAHITINANGDVTVVHDNFSVDCN
jgi:hypothetical protein